MHPRCNNISLPELKIEWKIDDTRPSHEKQAFASFVNYPIDSWWLSAWKTVLKREHQAPSSTIIFQSLP